MFFVVFQILSFGSGSKSNRRGKPQVLVHVSTYQGNPFWYWFFEPQPFGYESTLGFGGPPKL